MSVRDTVFEYGSVSKFFHWVIATLVLIMLIVGFSFNFIKNEAVSDVLFTLHKSTGLNILVLVILWSIWRLANMKPSLEHIPLWQKRAAISVHTLLFLLLIIMPISGWVMSVAAGYPPVYYGLFTVSLPIAKNKLVADAGQNVHDTLAFIIAGLVIIHILAALQHYFFTRDQVLQRMLPKAWQKPRPL